MTGRSISEEVSTKLRRIAELAREDPNRVLLNLAHHIDVDFLKEAYRLTRKDAAPGVDGQTAKDYGANLEANLQDLLNRFKSGRYFAPPVRRTYIPKGDGRTRPLGIPTFEDKVLQRAVTMVMSAVYEVDFLDSSHAYRPGRSPKGALRDIREGLMEMHGGWVLDVDVKGYFDAIDHGKLREILDQRVRDGVVRRQIDKWLKAGVLEDGELHRPERGTPQGGVISPLLANIYLHEALDRWFEGDVRPRMRGRCFQVRFADDFVLVFEREDDARRVLEVLPKRLARFGLEIHPEKTKLVRFNRPGLSSTGKGSDSEGQRPGSFGFLGFTHIWARSRRGYWVIKRRTATNRLQRSLKAVNGWCRIHRHWKRADQHEVLSAKIRGHCQYYGIRGNSECLSAYHRQVERIWKFWLGRRSQRGYLPWAKFKAYLRQHPLPTPSVVPNSIA